MYEVARSTLAQANDAQSIRVRTAVIASPAQIIEVGKCKLRKASEIIRRDRLDRTMR
jgi:hypothetical protein